MFWYLWTFLCICSALVGRLRVPSRVSIFLSSHFGSSQLHILSSNFLRSLHQLLDNKAMCECLGCSGCKQSSACQGGKCNWMVGKYYHHKCAKRCHFCFEHTDAEKTHRLSQVVVANGSGPRQHARSAPSEHAATHVRVRAGCGCGSQCMCREYFARP